MVYGTVAELERSGQSESTARILKLDSEPIERFGYAAVRIAEQSHFCGDFNPVPHEEFGGWRFIAPNGVQIVAGDTFSCPRWEGRKDQSELTVVAGNAFFGWQRQFEIPFFVPLEDLPRLEAAVAAYNEAFKDEQPAPASH
jgi:hypothetical protein